MTHDTRKACRQMARELDIKGMALQALEAPAGRLRAVKGEGLLIGMHDGVLTIRDTTTAVRVFEQSGSDVIRFHNGPWVDRLKRLARARHIAANFSC